jgi:hypothetical protein
MGIKRKTFVMAGPLLTFAVTIPVMFLTDWFAKGLRNLVPWISVMVVDEAPNRYVAATKNE